MRTKRDEEHHLESLALKERARIAMKEFNDKLHGRFKTKGEWLTWLINRYYERNSNRRAERLTKLRMAKNPDYQLEREIDGSYSVVLVGGGVCTTATTKERNRVTEQSGLDGSKASEAPAGVAVEN